MLYTTKTLSDNETRFIVGFAQGGESAATWVATLRDEKLKAFIDRMMDMLSADSISTELVDVLHTARLDGRISIKQATWWQKEIQKALK